MVGPPAASWKAQGSLGQPSALGMWGASSLSKPHRLESGYASIRPPFHSPPHCGFQQKTANWDD